jgi:geranylgeranyl pyrophosphate synthase
MSDITCMQAAPLDLLRQRCLPVLEADLQQQLQASASPLADAMGYALLGGGKRVRPLLAFAGASAVGADPMAVRGLACALEMVHSYSLAHDDLPAMDNDSLRRGRPTCHIQFDEATAILTGDALQALAFEVLTRDSLPVCTPDTPDRRLMLVNGGAVACGSAGLVDGQCRDLAAEKSDQLDLTALSQLHQLKTGALIRASAVLGARAGGCDHMPTLQHLDQYAHWLGLAFQIKDDILDVTTDSATLGKPQGSDAERGKSTYCRLLGLEGAQQHLADACTRALDHLKDFDSHADSLRALVEYVRDRNH